MTRCRALLVAASLLAASCGGSKETEGKPAWKRVAACKGFEACNAACDDGDGDACASVGLLLSRGEYVAIDPTKAQAAWSKGCELGASRACGVKAMYLPAASKGPEAAALRRRAFDLRKEECESKRVLRACVFRVDDLERGWDPETKEGKDEAGADKLRAEIFAATVKQCDEGIADACSEAALLTTPHSKADTDEGRNLQKPLRARACQLDPDRCWVYGELLAKLGDPAARSTIEAACDADPDGGSCFDPTNHADVRLHEKYVEKKRATCAKGLRESCLDLAGKEPDGWATRPAEDRKRDRAVALELLRGECDRDLGESCYRLASLRGLGEEGQTMSGPVVLEVALLNEKACRLAEESACNEAKLHPLIRDVVRLYPGQSHSCFQRTSGAVECFGVPLDGVTGGPRDDHDDGLHTISLPSKPREVAVSFSSNCALLESGDVRCWGKNPTNHSDRRGEPFLIEAFAGAKHVVASDEDEEMCAELPGRRAVCFSSMSAKGGDRFEEVDQVLPLGDSRLIRRGAKVVWSSGLGGEKAFTVEPAEGRFDATRSGLCAVRPDGTVACAAVEFNGHGQSPFEKVPLVGAIRLRVVPGVADAVEISMMTDYACALRRTGRVTCWTLREVLPKELEGLEEVVQLTNACAVTKKGYSFCWGGRDEVPWGTVEVMRVTPWNSKTR